MGHSQAAARSAWPRVLFVLQQALARRGVPEATVVIAGALSPLGWAPWGIWPLALLGHAVLLAVWGARTRKGQGGLEAFVLTVLFQLAMQAVGHAWSYPALHDRAHVPTAVALGLSFIGMTYVAVLMAIPLALLSTTVRRLPCAGMAGPWSLALAGAGALVCGEWLRGVGTNGFTSLSLGYALIDSPLAGLGPVLGLFGLSLAGYALCALAAAIVLEFAAPPEGRQRGDRTNRFSAALAASGLLFVGGALALRTEWVEPSGRMLSFALLQANVEQEEKFDPTSRILQVQRYLDLIEAQTADIVLAPETALPLFLHELPPDALQRLVQHGLASDGHLFIGLPTQQPGGLRHNSVLQIAGGSGRQALYHKARLMPFGEFSPAGLSLLANLIDVPLKDLTPGSKDQAPLALGGGQHAGVLICQEGMVGEDARHWARDATLLLNPSNLAWFDGTPALAQHLQMARMRALEVGRPVLRAANSGVTAAIDHRGQVRQRLPLQTAGVLTGALQPMTGLTPYARWGDAAAMLLAVACLVAPLWLGRARRLWRGYAAAA